MNKRETIAEKFGLDCSEPELDKEVEKIVNNHINGKCYHDAQYILDALQKAVDDNSIVSF